MSIGRIGKENGRKKKANGSTLTKKPLQQMRLAVGQRVETTCRECGMQYLASDEQDSRLHKRFHVRAYEGLEWNANYGKTIQTFPDGGAIVQVDAVSRNAEKKAVEDLLELVNRELNAPAANEAWKNEVGQGAAYIYVVKKRAVGLLLVERVSKGRWLDTASGELLENAEQVDTVLMGISRIYTTKNHRRNRVATKLLNACTNHFIYGIRVEKTQIAWSQPSTLGTKLAVAWSGVQYRQNLYKVLSYLE
jgi:N-acetyltransferase